jgi:hypothetical protein
MPTVTRSKPPLSRRLQAKAFRVINIPMRAMLGLPFPTPAGRRLMLVHLTGRKTGQSYLQPVSYVRHEDTLLTPGGGNWKLNLAEGRAERIRLRGRDIHARPEIISEADTVESLLAVMVEHNPMVAKFVGVPRTANGRFDRARLQTALRYGFRIIRWHPDPPGLTR